MGSLFKKKNPQRNVNSRADRPRLTPDSPFAIKEELLLSLQHFLRTLLLLLTTTSGMLKRMLPLRPL